MLYEYIKIGKEASDMLIEDEETARLIIENQTFKDRIKKLIKKYGEGNKELMYQKTQCYLY